MKKHSFFFMVASAAIFLGFGAIDMRADTPLINFSQATNVITVSQYAAFLNAEAASDPHHLYDLAMGGDPSVGNIERSGEDGHYSYGFSQAAANAPIMYVGIEAGMRFCNWLQNMAAQSTETAIVQPCLSTEAGTYDLRASSMVANPRASYLLTSEEEINFTTLHCNKVELIVVFNSAAVGQMIGGSEVEEIGEIFGSEEFIETIVTSLGAVALGLGTGGRDSEITEHENSDTSSHSSAFSVVHPAGDRDWLSGREYDNSSPRMMLSSSPSSDNGGIQRVVPPLMTPPVAQRKVSDGSLKSDGSPQSETTPETIRQISSGSGDHTSTERNSSGEKLTHEKIEKVFAKSSPEEDRLTQENIARVTAYHDAQQRITCLNQQKASLENNLESINSELTTKKKAAEDAVNNLTFTQRVRAELFNSSTSAKKAAQLSDEYNRIVQRKTAIGKQLSTLKSQLQSAHNEVARLSQPLTEPQQPSAFVKAPAKSYRDNPPAYNLDVVLSDEGEEKSDLFAKSSAFPLSQDQRYLLDSKEDSKSIDRMPNELMTVEEVRRRVIAYHKADEKVEISKMWLKSAIKNKLNFSEQQKREEEVQRVQEVFAIAEKEYLNIPNTPAAERGQILAKYDIALNWLEGMKDSRQNRLEDIGKYLYNGNLNSYLYKSKKELYDKVNGATLDLITAAQAYNEARINALPSEEQQLERARLASLSEAERNQEIYALAGVQGPRITPEEERAAKEEYAAEEVRRKAALEVRNAKREAEEQARADAEGRKYLWMTKAESDALEIKAAKEEAERATRRAAGYRWTPPMQQSSYQPAYRRTEYKSDHYHYLGNGKSGMVYGYF